VVIELGMPFPLASPPPGFLHDFADQADERGPAPQGGRGSTRPRRSLSAKVFEGLAAIMA